MKTVHLTSAHNRYDTRIFQKECCSLAEAGYEVYLLVADGGLEERLKGVRIVSVDNKRGRLGRLLLTPIKLFLLSLKIRADVYHFHDPELLPVGLVLKLFRKKVVYDIHENVGMQLSTRQWLPRLMRKPLGRIVDAFEGLACRFFDAMVVPQPSMKTKFDKYGPTYLVANFVDLGDPRINTASERKDSFIIFHAGGLSEARGLFSMLDVAAKLEDAKLALAGRFENELTELRARNHPAWDKVNYLGVISKKEASKWYEKTDLGLILYHNIGQYYLAYAIKLFEYMEQGIPVIMPNFGAWIDFCSENQCGECVDVHNASEIVDVIEKLQLDKNLVRRFGLAGREAVEKKYNWKIAEQELLKLYKEIIG